MAVTSSTHHGSLSTRFWNVSRGIVFTNREVRYRCWTRRPGLQWAFWFIVKVLIVMTMFCFLHTKLVMLELESKTISKLLPQGWKHKISQNVFVSCSINSTLHWRHLNSKIWREVWFLQYSNTICFFKLTKGLGPRHVAWHLRSIQKRHCWAQQVSAKAVLCHVRLKRQKKKFTLCIWGWGGTLLCECFIFRWQYKGTEKKRSSVCYFSRVLTVNPDPSVLQSSQTPPTHALCIRWIDPYHRLRKSNEVYS